MSIRRLGNKPNLSTGEGCIWFPLIDGLWLREKAAEGASADLGLISGQPEPGDPGRMETGSIWGNVWGIWVTESQSPATLPVRVPGEGHFPMTREERFGGRNVRRES